MMRRTRSIVLCFIIIVITVVCLQLGLSLYTSVISRRFVTPTTSSSEFYKLKELTSEQKLENAKEAQTTTAIPLYAAFGHKTTLITNKTCAQYYSLLILVSSAPANKQRRNYIRKTWGFERAFKPRWTTVFLIAQTRIQNESNSLLKEDEVYGDLVRADYYDHYYNQTRKIQMGFEWATLYCKFAFLLKTDDDVFVNSAGLVSFLGKPSTPVKEVYMGYRQRNPVVFRFGKWKVTKEEYSETYYPDFCSGFGYVLSYDAVISFVKAFASVPFFRLDDVYVGMLAKGTGIKITHHIGFEYEKKIRQCIPNESTLLRHGFETQEDCLFEIFHRSTKILETGLLK